MSQFVNTNQNNINISLAPPAASSNQFPWLLRALYFLIIGWWLSAVWVVLAWVVAVTVIGLPLAQQMFNRTNGVLTLQRYR